MNKKKLTKLGVSLALVGAIGVGSTLAYLSSQSEKLTNAITVGEGFNPGDDGKPAIVLDETFVPSSVEETNTHESPLVNTRTKFGNTYENVNAGDVLTKDPTVHLLKTSTDAYIFVKVQGLDELVAKRNTADEQVFNVEINTKWEKYKDDGDDTDAGLDGVYFWGVVDNKTTIQETYESDINDSYYSTKALFDNITVNNVKNLNDKNTKKTITVDNIYVGACAVQAKSNGEKLELNEAYNDVTFPTF